MRVAWDLDLTPVQRAIVTDPHRNILAIAGRRGGKSWAGLVWLCMQALKRHGTAWYFGQYSVTVRRDRWPDLLRIARTFPLPVQEHGQEMRIDFPYGASVQLLGGDNPKGMHGGQCVALQLDEYALLSPSLYEITLEPATVITQAPVLFTATPDDSGPHLEDLYDKAISAQEAWGIHRWSTVDGGLVDPAEIARKRMTTDPRVFRQQYEGSFEVLGGRVWSEFSRKIHVVDPGECPDPELCRYRFVGVDWGWTQGFMVVLVEDGQGIVWAIEEQVRAEVPVTDQGWLGIAADIDERLHPTAWHPDPSAPGFVTQLKATVKGAVVPPKRNDEKDVRAGIDLITELLHVDPRLGKPRLRISSACPTLIRQMERYSWDLSPGIEGRKARPAKRNDHGADAARYALVCHRLAFKLQSW